MAGRTGLSRPQRTLGSTYADVTSHHAAPVTLTADPHPSYSEYVMRMLDVLSGFSSMYGPQILSAQSRGPRLGHASTPSDLGCRSQLVPCSPLRLAVPSPSRRQVAPDRVTIPVCPFHTPVAECLSRWRSMAPSGLLCLVISPHTTSSRGAEGLSPFTANLCKRTRPTSRSTEPLVRLLLSSLPILQALVC